MTKREKPAPRPSFGARAPQTPRFFATAAKGTEGLLAEELVELGLPNVRAARGGVHFGARSVDAYRACLWSRIALRIVEAVARFPCADGDDLYAGVRAFDWGPYFDSNQTIAVRAAGQTPQLTHTHFVAMKTKDAVVDQLRERRGSRPSVDRDDADVLLFVHLAQGHATVNLDYSGGSLHEHGFRTREGVAPLRETLAAALVRFSGWTGDTPVLDPMCGSGTLLLEAGSWAARKAPGLSRSRFGFERWGTFDDSARRALAELREEARSLEREPPPLFGSDTDAQALAQTRENAARAGLDVQLQALPFTRQRPATAEGALLANPPYGQRLQAPANLERDIESLLDRFEGHQRALIVPRTFRVTKKASRWLEVYNGPLECEFRRYDANQAGREAPTPADRSTASGPSSASAQGRSVSRSALRRSSALTRGPTTPK